jgi:hypothetical protein
VTREEIIRRSGSAEAITANPDQKEIEALAYQLWIQRGRPNGSPNVDWLRAEEELRKAHQSVARAA